MFAWTWGPLSHTKPPHTSQNASLWFCFPAMEKRCDCSVWMRYKGVTHLDDSRRSRFYGAQRRWTSRRSRHTPIPQFHHNCSVRLYRRHSIVFECDLMIRKSNVFRWNWYTVTHNVTVLPTVNLITVQLLRLMIEMHAVLQTSLPELLAWLQSHRLRPWGKQLFYMQLQSRQKINQTWIESTGKNKFVFVQD